MRIGIIGGGRVGSALTSGWQSAGHELRTASRSSATRPRDVAQWAEVLVLAVPYTALEGLAAELGALKGTPVIDCTNPIAMGPDGPGLAVGHTTSGAETLQALLPRAHVVKALNQVGAEVMADTTGFAHPPVQLFAGDSDAAKTIVAGLLTDLGFEPLDAGPLARARLLEPFALVWINQAMARGKGRNWAFGAMTRDGAAHG